MTTQALQTSSIMDNKQKEENFLLRDDLKSLTGAEKTQFYKDLCRHLGLDPITKPFGLYDFQGKEVLYIKANAFDQLCARNRVTRRILPQEVIIGDKIIKQDFVSMGDPSNLSELVYMVKVEASLMVDGEKVCAEDVAIVPQYDFNKYTQKYTRNNNALMKSITKAYRRAAQKLISIGTVLLEDDLEVQGTPRELSETGESVGGKSVEILDYKLPKNHKGYSTLKEMMLKEGDDSLIELDKTLSKQTLSEEWKAVRVVIKNYFDAQV